MDAGAVARALEDARFDARQDSRHEHLADDESGRAELAEWGRIEQLPADAAPNAVSARTSAMACSLSCWNCSQMARRVGSVRVRRIQVRVISMSAEGIPDSGSRPVITSTIRLVVRSDCRAPSAAVALARPTISRGWTQLSLVGNWRCRVPV